MINEIMYDIAVIGGGVVGGTILRELSKYKIKTVMLEKTSDVCMGQSKANSGIVHAGFDALNGTLKAKFNVRGSEMMENYAKELGVKYKNNGSLVVAFSNSELETLETLEERGKKNGVKGLTLISKSELKALEPNVSDNALGALFAKTGGIICPYELTVSAIGNAMDNGAELKLDFNVTKINNKNGYFELASSDGEKVSAKTLINCAGAGSEDVARLAGDDSIKIGLRRGEYILLDRESGDLVSHTLFFCPTEKGKGILVTNTVDGNILLGPTAEEIDDNDTDTTSKGLSEIKNKAAEMIAKVPFYNTITSFAGVRAYSEGKHDFIIENSKNVKGLINVCGIESPGLTSAPAIAEFVVENLIPPEYKAVKNASFNPERKPDNFFKLLNDDEKNEIIRKNHEYGRIVCRCEQITEGEIVEAIHKNPPALTVDAIKRRTRSGMGRCQGGFCGSRVTEIIARELNVPLEEVRKSSKNSQMLVGKTK